MACSANNDIFSPDFDYVDISTAENSTLVCNCSDPRFWFVVACDCDYPIEESVNVQDVLPLGVMYALVFLFGIFGNIAVIIGVAKYKKLRSTTNYYLASLSTSDLFLVLFCVPVQVRAFT